MPLCCKKQAIGGSASVETKWAIGEGAVAEDIAVDKLCIVDVDSHCTWDGAGTECTMGSLGLLAIVAFGWTRRWGSCWRRRASSA